VARRAGFPGWAALSRLGGAHIQRVIHGIMEWIGEEVCFLMAPPGSPRPANYAHCGYIHDGYLHRMPNSAAVTALLPLPAATFHILLAVAHDERHGYAIIQDIEGRTDGALRLSAATLYRSIQRMLEQGLLKESHERPAPDLDDERRRYYRITPLGRAAARAETQRLQELVWLARAQGIMPAKS
jgi:DNA-binding PadR family transcriptional regulator